RSAKARRRRALAVLVCAGGAAAAGAGLLSSGPPRPMVVRTATGAEVEVPEAPHLSALRAKIVAVALSQIGYRTDPPTTYCNKYSAYWYSGAGGCGNGNLAEEWCADFAAWVWQQAGAPVTYQYINGDLNSSAASFYEWGRAKGTWHPLGSGYLPRPGDVAVYGLEPSKLVAAHVAIVLGYKRGERGPIAVNGDGDISAYSEVEVQADEYDAYAHPFDAPLSGYVSPTTPAGRGGVAEKAERLMR
ncbi:MAG TPA: CHAP domain-containing protein, partial [Acidimicrobiales bacterium]|nr:CHAP domain-containing protein [Acidimicrobiales bacterium]